MSEKQIVNTLYHGAVIGGLALAYNRLGRLILKAPPSKLEFNARDAGMVVADTVDQGLPRKAGPDPRRHPEVASAI
jgi:hypothetical protein